MSFLCTSFLFVMVVSMHEACDCFWWCLFVLMHLFCDGEASVSFLVVCARFDTRMGSIYQTPVTPGPAHRLACATYYLQNVVKTKRHVFRFGPGRANSRFSHVVSIMYLHVKNSVTHEDRISKIALVELADPLRTLVTRLGGDADPKATAYRLAAMQQITHLETLLKELSDLSKSLSGPSNWRASKLTHMLRDCMDTGARVV